MLFSVKAIFLATCNAILFLGDVKLANTCFKFSDVCFTYQTFVTNLHHLEVELRCKLEEELHHVTGPLLWVNKFLWI